MDTTEEIKLPLRILVDRERNKVLFAEAEGDFIDTLFSFLTLPMGTIVRILKKHSDSQPEAIGSFNTMYEGVENLHAKHMWTEECKYMLLNPRNSAEAQCFELKLKIDDTEPTKYFICENWSCIRGSSTTFLSTCSTAICNCGKLTNREIAPKVNTGNGGGVFVLETASFVISDDLHVNPNLPGYTFGLLKDLGIRDISVLEEITLVIGFKEILNLLKCSILSKSPLTDIFLSKKQINLDIVKSEPGDHSADQPQTGKETTTNTKKMTVKVMVQKSNNKVLFAQAEEDFIDFLFSFLTIPFGSVLSLLGGNTSLGSMGKLYKSVLTLSIGRYIKSKDMKDMLLNPLVASMHLRKNQIFSLNEVQFYCYSHVSSGQYKGYLTLFKGQTYYGGGEAYSQLTVKNPKGEGGFIRGPSMFMVTDDLIVTPLSSSSSISFLKRLKIPLCDVEEQVISIGPEEAVKILKASLESTSALTNGLNLMPKKPKQENGSF